jgi:hypothetical protein
MQTVKIRNLTSISRGVLFLVLILILCSCDLYGHRNENLQLRNHLINEFAALRGITITASNFDVTIKREVTKLTFSEFRKIDEIKDIVTFLSKQGIFPERFRFVPLEVRFFFERSGSPEWFEKHPLSKGDPIPDLIFIVAIKHK